MTFVLAGVSSLSTVINIAPDHYAARKPKGGLGIPSVPFPPGHHRIRNPQAACVPWASWVSRLMCFRHNGQKDSMWDRSYKRNSLTFRATASRETSPYGDSSTLRQYRRTPRRRSTNQLGKLLIYRLFGNDTHTRPGRLLNSRLRCCKCHLQILIIEQNSLEKKFEWFSKTVWGGPIIGVPFGGGTNFGKDFKRKTFPLVAKISCQKAARTVH